MRISADLTGVRGKLDRASVHLEGFTAAEIAWVGTRPYLLRQEIFTLGSSEPNLAFFAQSADSVPVEIRTIVGDVLTNLRAALNHLARQAVLDAGGVPNHNTYFPMLAKQRSVVVEGGVATPVLRYLENVQPWGKSARAPSLALLKGLVNVDKHRQLGLVGIAREEMFFTFANG